MFIIIIRTFSMKFHFVNKNEFVIYFSQIMRPTSWSAGSSASDQNESTAATKVNPLYLNPLENKNKIGYDLSGQN